MKIQNEDNKVVTGPLRSLKGLGHSVLGNFVLFSYLFWSLNVKLAEQESFIFRITAT